MDDAPKAARVTLAHVAKAAGVSASSVANVLHDHPHVRQEIRDRVQRAVDELGYRPLAIGQNLRRGRVGAIALAIPNFAQPYFSEIASAAVTAGQRHGLRLVAQQTDNRLDRELEAADAWNLGSADGLIFSPSVIDDEELDRRRGLMPLVLLGEHSHLSTVDRVGIDSVAVSRLAVGHLVQRGSRRIAMLGHKTSGDSYVVREREQGFREVLHEAGLQPGPVVEVDDWTRQDGQLAMRELLSTGVEFDGVFCANDLLALGAMRSLREAGRTVPTDVRIVGIDDIEDAAFSEPGLTTVAIDRHWMVERAFDLIVRRMADQDAPAQRLIAPHRLVVRSSC